MAHSLHSYTVRYVRFELYHVYMTKEDVVQQAAASTKL